MKRNAKPMKALEILIHLETLLVMFSVFDKLGKPLSLILSASPGARCFRYFQKSKPIPLYFSGKCNIPDFKFYLRKSTKRKNSHMV